MLAPPGVLQISIYVSSKEAATTPLDLPATWELRTSIHPDVPSVVTELTTDSSTASVTSFANPEDIEKGSQGPTRPLSSVMSPQTAAVVVCGPEGMARDASNAVASLQASILRGRLPHLAEVCLINESFSF
jgi:hypothetical protein